MTMHKLLNVSEMIAIEKASDSAGHTYERMMAAAGKSLAEKVIAAYSQNSHQPVALLLVGNGNNGGDTLVAGKWLLLSGFSCQAYLGGLREGDRLVEEFRSAGGVVFEYSSDDNLSQLQRLAEAADLVIDGFLGTGIKLPLREPVKSILSGMKLWASEWTAFPGVIAVDCPSGVNCDTGEVARETLSAQMTVSMAAVKEGLLKLPAFDFLGELVVGEIGLDPELPAWKQIDRFSICEEYFQQTIPPRRSDAHKGTFGKTLVVGGSVNYPGAPILAGKAAFRAGAGWVTIGIPENLHPLLAGSFLEATWKPLPGDEAGLDHTSVRGFCQGIADASAVLIGPGLGLTEGVVEFVSGSIACTQIPLVVDADGLKAMATKELWWEGLPKPCVLTPHPGEFSILTGLEVEKIQADRSAMAREAAKLWDCVVVLKGAFTVIADPSGICATLPLATPALARAGTGDVLAGIIAGLLAQGLSGFNAACCGVWAHGQAGLMAKEITGSSAGVLAGDLIEMLPGILPY